MKKTLFIISILTHSLLYGHGAIDESISEKTVEISQEPDNGHLYLERGILHEKHEDLLLAIADFEMAASLEPNAADYDFLRGKIYLLAERDDTALIFLNRTLKKDSDNAMARLLRAQAYFQLKNYPASVVDYDYAISSLPTVRPEYIIYQTQAHLKNKATGVPAAIKSLEEGIKKIGPVITLQNELLKILTDNKMYDQAIAQIDKIVSKVNRHEPWLIKRAKLQFAKGDFDQALKDIQSAEKLYIDLPAYVRDRGVNAKMGTEIKKLKTLLEKQK